MIKGNKTLTSEEYLRIIETRNHFNKNNIALFNKRNKTRFVFGVVLFGIGIISFPIPFITIPILIFSGGLMGWTLKDVINKKKALKHIIKYKIAKRLKN